MELKDYLDKDELKYFTKKSNVRAYSMLVTTWASIFAIFAMAYIWTNPFTIVLAVLLLAGRQLGLAVLMHDCGHNVFLETKAQNQFVGQWFCSNPILQDLPSYARGHLRHHKHAGTVDDPDLKNYKHYPIEKASFKRKLVRDLTGKTGMKLFKLVLNAAMGIFDPEKREFAKPYAQEFVVQAIFIGILALVMSPWLYLLWIASWLTFYMFIVRLRQVAEHAAVEDLYDLDPRKNTRTTIPTWLERVFVAPNYVNYHLEHHFMLSVPCYKLSEFHQFLKSKGAYDDTKITYGYREVLKEALI